MLSSVSASTKKTPQKPRVNRVRIGLVAIMLLLFSVVFIRAASGIDYDLHGQLATKISSAETTSEPVPHFLYHLLIIGFSEILPGLPRAVQLALPVILMNVLTGLLLFELLRCAFNDVLSPGVTAGLSLSLMILSPVFLGMNLPYVPGYIHPTIYHNPTQNILKLFVIPVTIFAWLTIQPRVFQSRNRRIFLVLLAFLMTLLMSISKPNYALCLIPALGLCVLYRMLRRQPVDWLLLIVGLALPMAGMLVLQFLVTYSSGDDSTIAIGFLYFFSLLEIPPDQLALQVALSMLFPAAIYVLYYQKAIQNTALNLCWLTFGMGLVYFLFFYETGDRLLHGNFAWGSYISLFVLMVASVWFVLHDQKAVLRTITRATPPQQIPWRLQVVGYLFLLHVLSGVRYYLVFSLHGA